MFLLGSKIKRRYDNRGNLIEIKDPNQVIRFCEYDKTNRPNHQIFVLN